MKVLPTELPGVLVVEPRVFGDDRGFFLELFHALRYEADVFGGSFEVLQLNHSRSVRNTLRGLHYQEPHAQGKLVWVVSGSVRDVAVDVRRGSPTFGKFTVVDLSADRHNQVWIPPGFAHGFVVTSDAADFMYACTALYAPECERAIRWDDPDIGIDWGVRDPILSPKDREAPRLCESKTLPRHA
jgi:dTDP-4-dehydrorhamnose 3,5-epimerase